jgi:subtilisin family serine protease
MLDFQLRHLREAAPADERVRVLLLYKNKNDLAELEKLGFQVSSLAGDVAAGSVPARGLEELSKHPNVIFVEASRTLKDETDVSAVDINLIDPVLLRRTIPGGGRNAIIGVIDSGFDLTHRCFTNTFTTKTRILAAWDQTATEGGTPPPAFGYGVEFTQAVIQQNIDNGNALANGRGHGTNIAGIAAGNGTPDGIYKGIAPEADLVLVTYKNDVPIGGSSFVLDAIDFIRRMGDACDRPVVINLSQGDHLGPHDGSSLLERAIDNIVSTGRCLVVKSAGNGAGIHQPSDHHAHGQLSPGQDFILPFELKPLDKAPIRGDTVELWYNGNDLLSVALKTPSGWQSGFIPAGQNYTIEFRGGPKASVYSNLNHPLNGDNHIGIVLQESSNWETGEWELILRGDKISNGEFDAWVDRPNAPTRIAFRRHNSDARTITIPGNGHQVIAVGGFVSRPDQGGDTGEVKGSIAMGSSHGPTRDGRLKPNITAPSSLICTPTPRSATGESGYFFMRGTSMSAPHVTGAIALLWGVCPELTSQQIQHVLYRTARKDQFTGPSANFRWGHGKLDIGAAYKFIQSQTEVETKSMSKTRTCEFQLSLRPAKAPKKTVTVQIDIDDNKAVAIRGLDEHGEEVYEVSLKVRKMSGKKGGDECYECRKPNTPCPPNELVEVECLGGGNLPVS